MHYPSNHANPRRLHRFHGGLHLPDNKSQSTGTPIQPANLPPRLILPLQQHIGAIARPLVSIGEGVLKGQMIAAAQGTISAPVHAPSSGVITDIREHAVPHASGLQGMCIIIDTDGRDQWCELPEPIADVRSMTPETLRQRIRDAGIVGMGGAAFPTSIKVTPGSTQPIKTLIINGAECEPYITCDDMLMRERADRVATGTAILRQLVEADECLIGIEDNKPEAVTAMTRAVEEIGLDRTEVVTIPTLYPSGGEKQLIMVLTGREVPSKSIPAQIGILCHNAGTAAAVADAVLEGKPLISRYLTLTGQGIANPRNLEVLIGTPVSELIKQAGGYTKAASRLIVGGPMMGYTLQDDGVPITKPSNCLLVAGAAEAPAPGPASPCIRCGQCAAVCPANLLPQQMYWHARAKDLEKVQEYNLFDCIECGCCSHVCPSHIPLVQYYRFAKNESWAQEQEKIKSDHARIRFEARTARLARMEAEKKARLRKKKAVLKKKPTKAGSTVDPKKAAIQAALKRAAEKKAKQAEEGVLPGNTEQLSEPQKRQIEQADSRRSDNRQTSVETETQDG
ncbi:MAG: electron transport complex subunit RsxC [Gammaproteobacteria bacterium]|nr:electron transport complex subunit RsxC [Gammaproteobacteria bacterium]